MVKRTNFQNFSTPQTIAKACIFLAAKVEEQPHRLKDVISIAHYIINGSAGHRSSYVQLDLNSDVCPSFNYHHPPQTISKACVFLAAKVEEQPRPMKAVINHAHYLMAGCNRSSYMPFDVNSEVCLNVKLT